MNKKYILSLDQGTSSSRAIIFDHTGQIIQTAQKEFRQIFPEPGWVEHNPEDILNSQVEVMQSCVQQANIDVSEIAAIGITNQRETTIVWDRRTGKAIHNAIVWQDRRTAAYCDELKAGGHAETIRDKTGLVLDAYFSGTKLKWILDHVEGSRSLAAEGHLAFGTVDSWLLWNLTEGHVHATDVSNASRTLLYHLEDLKWDDDMLKLLDIPSTVLPEVKSSSEVYGQMKASILGQELPIAGIAGDQQAALFGQLCVEPGMAKNTYGTGCFLVLNTGEEIVKSNNNLLTTIAWQIDGKTTYALEGSVFIGGAVIQWLRDGLGFMESASESESMAAAVPDNGGVYFVPALTGLGAPHWDQFARGSIFGLTRGSRKEHIVRAALESICFQVYDVIEAMKADAGGSLKELRVDGGAVSNNLLLQFQADLVDRRVIRPKILETTALGSAYLAGLAVGFWSSVEDLRSQSVVEKEFSPSMDDERRIELLKNWEKAISRSKEWDK